jgi:hypothetical protein
MCVNNWNIVGENRERRVFKIPVGELNDEAVQEYVNKIAESFKKYELLGDDIYLPVKTNKNHGTEIRDMWLGELESLVTTFADKTFKGESNTSEANRIKELIEMLQIK